MLQGIQQYCIRALAPRRADHTGRRGQGGVSAKFLHSARWGWFGSVFAELALPHLTCRPLTPVPMEPGRHLPALLASKGLFTLASGTAGMVAFIRQLHAGSSCGSPSQHGSSAWADLVAVRRWPAKCLQLGGRKPTCPTQQNDELQLMAMAGGCPSGSWIGLWQVTPFCPPSLVPHRRNHLNFINAFVF